MADQYREFSVPLSRNGSRLSTVKIGEPNLQKLSLGLSTWGASTVLSKLLCRFDVSLASFSSPASSLVLDGTLNPERKRSVDVLELGAGTGLAGIAAAMVWGAHVVLTDLPEVVPNLAMNVELNAKELEVARSSAVVGTLDWASPGELMPHRASGCSDHGKDGVATPWASSKFRVILAADTVYSEELPAQFVSVVVAWLERSSFARLIIAYPLRVSGLDHVRDLWNKLEECGLHDLQEGKEQIQGEWDDERLVEWSIWGWASP